MYIHYFSKGYLLLVAILISLLTSTVQADDANKVSNNDTKASSNAMQ